MGQQTAAALPPEISYPPGNAVAGPSTARAREDADIIPRVLSDSQPLSDSPLHQTPLRDDPEGGEGAAPVTHEDPADIQHEYPALALRRTIFRRCLTGINQLGSGKRWMLIAKAVVVFAEIVTFVTLLALTFHQSCDKPLRTFLSLHLVRISLAWPLSFYNKIAPRRRRDEQANPESRARREAMRVIGSPLMDDRVQFGSDVMSVFALVLFILGNYWFFSSNTCRATSPMLFWGSLGALFFGFVFALEVALLVIVVLFFLPIALYLLPIFGVGAKKHEIGPLSAAEIEKIPLVTFIPAATDTTPPSSEQPTEAPVSSSISTNAVEMTEISQNSPHVPTSPSEITQSPPAEDNIQSVETSTKTAAATASETTHSANTNSSQTSASKTMRKPRKRRLLRLFRRSRKEPVTTNPTDSAAKDAHAALFVTGPYPLQSLPENLSTCPICLCDFEPAPLKSASVEENIEFEALRLLPCKHVLHKECLDPWLSTSGRCPICQHPVKPQANGRRKSAPVSAVEV